MSDEYDEERVRKMAEKMGKNARAEDVENVAKNLGSMNRGPIAKIWDKVQAMWKAFNSPDTPSSIKVMIIGGLIYLVSPIDVIPDFIPVLGLMDDAGVLVMIFNKLVKLGAIAATTYAVIKVSKLTYSKLKKILQQKKEEAYKHIKEDLTAKISRIRKTGGYNIVNVGLCDKNDNKLEEFEIQADEIDDKNIFEGQVLLIE